MPGKRSQSRDDFPVAPPPPPLFYRDGRKLTDEERFGRPEPEMMEVLLETAKPIQKTAHPLGVVRTVLIFAIIAAVAVCVVLSWLTTIAVGLGVGALLAVLNRKH